MEYAKKIDLMSTDIYRYLNFDRLPEYTDKAAKAKIVGGRRSDAFLLACPTKGPQLRAFCGLLTIAGI